ncbi:DUF427 domain-containing protein [Pseudonocardia nigra]|uniref:DUF427 domain-containing protein n=1 Tax=Pseudonocardia nigra TaxID=1921578 RepID=UPI001C5EF48D|nr:DUF427 domain-containing protein [Pseudonocardia nigra]
MSLTISHGPLSAHARTTVNYRIDGPAHRLFLDPFPRRVRAVFADRTVLDTDRGMLLHETGLLSQLYVPRDDVCTDLLEDSAHRTHCPFKGDAAYHSMRVGDRIAEHAVWSYPVPMPGAEWLGGYLAFFWDRMDAWFDEAEQVYGHLRDPYHRVDTRPSALRVRVVLDDRLLAETDRPVMLSETGLPNRLYLPADDVRSGALTANTTTSVCPYKGTADYADAGSVADVAWRYRDPLSDAAAVAGHWCFDDEKVQVQVRRSGDG